MTSLRRPLAVSLALHTLPLLLLLLLGGSQGKGSDKATVQDKGKIIAKPDLKDSVEIEVIKVKGVKKPRPIAPHAKEVCKDWYGGIGITHNSFFMLDGVFPGYPAFNAGLEVGDKIITPINLIRGEVGTEVTIEYVKMSELEIKSVVLIRDKICTSGAEGQP